MPQLIYGFSGVSCSIFRVSSHARPLILRYQLSLYDLVFDGVLTAKGSGEEDQGIDVQLSL